jgi:hypothetical protein
MVMHHVHARVEDLHSRQEDFNEVASYDAQRP